MRENFQSKYIINKRGIIHGGYRLKKKRSKPLLSIITVVFNGEKYLEETIKSVLKQKNIFEYIIVDGKSKDNSLNIIKKYSNKISYWISEKDKGLYYAFNKGMELAQGDYIGIINSDDVYKKDAFKIIHKYIKLNPKADFIFGSVKKHWGILHGYRPKKIAYSWGFYSSHSTGFFIKRTSAKKVGLYNTYYKYHADYDYFYRMIVTKKLEGIATKKNEIVGIFRRGGFSSKIHYRDLFIEELKIRFKNGQSLLLITFIALFKFLKHFRKFIL
tara:strand:- start:5512 stop:6327 length:816 start_codon:yes stop_codon:yes gene_type:complete